MDSSSLPTAESTAILPSITSDHDLRVSCYCEENAWRLVYRHLHLNKQTPNSTNNCNYFVVFVSNDKRCCPFFNQRAKPKPISTDDISTMDYVCWDYHVIVIRRRRTAAILNNDTKEGASQHNNSTEVLDIDTWIQPYPCKLEEYLYKSFPHVLNNNGMMNVDTQYHPNFRVIPAQLYIKYFYSDRSHMIDSRTGNWLATPPEYQPIMNGLALEDDNRMKRNNNDKRGEGEDTRSNLDMYIDMKVQSISSSSDNESAAFGRVYTLDELLSVYA